MFKYGRLTNAYSKNSKREITPARSYLLTPPERPHLLTVPQLPSPRRRSQRQTLSPMRLSCSAAFVLACLSAVLVNGQTQTVADA